MLNRGFFIVTIVCDRPQAKMEKITGELKHAISHSIHSIIVENVELEQTEGVLPMTEKEMADEFSEEDV